MPFFRYRCRQNEKRKKTQKVQEEALSVHQAGVLNSPDPGRLMILLFVKVFMIAHLLAFSLSDSDDVRLFFEVCAHQVFPRTKLYPKMVKHYIVEMYKATVSRFSHRLKSAVTGVGGASLHANFDLWTSKTSNEKYIGDTKYGYNVVQVVFGRAATPTVYDLRHQIICP